MLALDLFCGGGGAALGLMAAGFRVVGVDWEDHSRAYPGDFLLGDALRPPVRLEDFDFVWASPPCQAYSRTKGLHPSLTHPDLVPATRSLLAGHPYTVIENVVGAPIRPDIILTGPAVGLDRIQHRRHFEVSWPTLSPLPMRAARPQIIAGHLFRRADGLAAKGIPADMTIRQIAQAIPPAYARYVAESALRHMRSV